MIAKKKAGAGGHPAVAILERHQAYRPARRPSTRFSPRSVRPVRPANADPIALGWLVLYLTGRDLPRQERRTGWALAQRWLSEFVAARHCRGAA